MIAGRQLIGQRMAMLLSIRTSRVEWRVSQTTCIVKDYFLAFILQLVLRLVRAEPVGLTMRKSMHKITQRGKSTTSSMIIAIMRADQPLKDTPRWEMLSTKQVDPFFILFANGAKSTQQDGLPKLVTHGGQPKILQICLTQWLTSSSKLFLILMRQVLEVGTIQTCLKLESNLETIMDWISMRSRHTLPCGPSWRLLWSLVQIWDLFTN